MQSAQQKIAVVTGASRGGGKAIAIELGVAGWTVYVTGRSTRAGPTTENLPTTIEETRDAVTRAGGIGIAVKCDHSNISEIDGLVARLQKEQGHIDLLVNNAWGGYEHHDVTEFVRPFWEQPVSRWDDMFDRGLRPTLFTSARFGPIFVKQQVGLIINTVAWLHGDYLGNLYYDAAKAAIVRCTLGMAQELKPYGVPVIALAPGFMRTERVLLAHSKQPFDLSVTESPLYLARAVRAIVEDPHILEGSGQVLYVGDLARKYGFTDEDGRQPAPFTAPKE
jgi:NAD(P)-dependent dehydrogenase (short-subunit alcohol dehydrogenase family)